MSLDDASEVSSSSLTLGEAVPLCTVMALNLLEMVGIRALAIKGPAFVEIGVRQPRRSNDVDLLVDPEHFGEAEQTLRSADWEPWLKGVISDMETIHSLTFAHPSWPCTLDLHHHFPGILRNSEDAFEVLWADRVRLSLAHQPVLTVSRSHALAIELLHALRGAEPGIRQPMVNAFVNAMPRPLNDGEMAEFVDTIPRLGASRSLGPALEALGLSATAEGAEDPILQSQWNRYERFGSSGSGWIAVLRWRHPVRSARALARYVWLSDDASRRWAQSQGVAYRGRLSVLSIRLRRGAQALMRERRARGA